MAKQEDTSQKLKRFPCLLCNAPKSLNIEKLTPDCSLIGLLSLVASVPDDLEHELQSFRQVVTLQTKIIKELVSREMSCSETPKQEKSDAKKEITDSQQRDALAISDEIEVLYDGVWCKCFVSSIPSNGIVVSYSLIWSAPNYLVGRYSTLHSPCFLSGRFAVTCCFFPSRITRPSSNRPSSRNILLQELFEQRESRRRHRRPRTLLLCDMLGHLRTH